MFQNDKFLKILNTLVWVFIGSSIFIMFYSFTQPKQGQELTLVALATIAIGFGLNSLGKSIKKKLEEQEEENDSSTN